MYETIADIVTADQPLPTRSEHSIPVDSALIAFATLELPEPALRAVIARIELGKRRYGTTLHTLDGRDTWAEVWQELIDALYYAQKGILEEMALEDGGNSLKFAFLRNLIATGIKIVMADDGHDGKWVAMVGRTYETAHHAPDNRRMVLFRDTADLPLPTNGGWTAGYFENGIWHRADNSAHVRISEWSEIPNFG